MTIARWLAGDGVVIVVVGLHAIVQDARVKHAGMAKLKDPGVKGIDRHDGC